jgi:L-threonylcarbamoyladenylate synthase
MKLKTEIISVSDPGMLIRAVEVLNSGGLVAMPTDTVYGLGALAFDPDAVDKIYIAKGRSREKAIPILIGDLDDIEKVTVNLPLMARLLAEHFWPGPLTLIVPRGPSIPEAVSTTSGVGVRIPDHPVTRRILRAAGPVAVTSANLAGYEDPSNAQEVLEQLDGRISLIIDAGQVGDGLASTVVNCLGSEPVIIRKGPISLEEITEVLRLE